MPSLDERFLSKLIETGDWRAVENLRFSPEEMLTAQGRSILGYIQHHAKNRTHYGEVPSMDLVRRDYPKFSFSGSVTDSLAALMERIRQELLKTEIEEFATQLASTTDPQEAVSLISEGSTRFNIMSGKTNKDIDFATSMVDVLREYENTKVHRGLTGLPYPWAVMNEATLGMQRGEFIVIYGRPKNMKTMVMNWMAMYLYKHHNRRVLFYTREMPPEQIRRRMAACYCGFEYDAFKGGKLSPTEEDEFFDAVEELGHPGGTSQRGLLITSDREDVKRGGTVSGIRAKAEEFQADIVFIDPIYYLRDERENKRSVKWSNMSNICQDIKDMAEVLAIPVVGTNQANRSDGDNDMSFSDGFLQNADVAARVMLDKANQEAVVWLTALREARLNAFLINAKPMYDFNQKLDANQRPIMLSDQEVEMRKKKERKVEDKGADYVAENEEDKGGTQMKARGDTQRTASRSEIANNVHPTPKKKRK